MMSQWAKVTAAKPSNLSLIPEHTWWMERTDS